MTQKEKLGCARILAMTVKSIAASLRFDAKDYDCQFPLEHARRLEQAANKYLKLR